MIPRPSDSGSGSDSIVASMFIGDDGTPRWEALGKTLFGGVFLAFFESITETILEAARQASALLTGVGDFGATVVSLAFGSPASALGTSLNDLEAAVAAAGPLGFVAAVAAVLTIYYITSWGVSQIG